MIKINNRTHRLKPHWRIETPWGEGHDGDGNYTNAAAVGTTALASFFGGPAAGGAVAGMWGQHMTNEANRANARAQMDFQERMSGTAHQREAADLEAAGLNRLLTLGNGASTPQGASSTNVNPLEGAQANAIESLMIKGALEKQGLENKNLSTQNAVMKATQKKTEEETRALGRDAEKGEFMGKLWKKVNQGLDAAATLKPVPEPKREKMFDKSPTLRMRNY